ncbi:MAG TPA: CHAD domain-containing protein [Vicinamibacteria bacterium]
MDPQSALADRCTPLLKARMRGVFKRLPAALNGDEESIHQMRVAGRRLRVALPLLAQKPGGRRVRRAVAILRQLVRAASTSRDLDVSLALFEEGLRELGPLNPQQVVLRRRLRATRSRSRARMAEALLDIEIAKLRRHLRAIVGRRAESLFAALVRLRDERERRGSALAASLQALADRFDPDALHRLRIRARRLRYMAELRETLRGQPSEAPAVFRRLQEQLGAIRDLFVLSQWLAAQAGAARRRAQQPLAEEADRLHEFFLEKSRERHRAFLESGPAQVVAKGLEEMGHGRSAA